jgi:hypothetical protein
MNLEILKLTRRKGGADAAGGEHAGGGGGDFGGGGGDDSDDGHSGGGSHVATMTDGSTLDTKEVTTEVEGFPEGLDKVTTFGKGQGKTTTVKSGPFRKWIFGGGKRPQVYGNT